MDPSGITGWTVDFDQAKSFYSGLNDKELDDLNSNASKEMDENKRIQMYWEVHLFSKPRHPYTYVLMGSLPDQSKKGSKLKSIAGAPPDLSNLPEGCPFAPRCKYTEDICLKERPELSEIEPGHVIRCHCRDKVQSFKGIISVPDQKGGGDE